MRFAIAATMTLVLLPSLTCAQQALPIDQQQAMERAAERAPGVRLGRAQAQLAHSEVDVAGMLENPQVGGGVSPSYVAVATLSMALPVFGQTVLAADAAEAQARVADVSVDVLRLRARLSAALAWIDLWMVEQRSALAQEEVTRYERTLSAAEARVESGSAPALDRVRAVANARRAHSALVALAAAHDAAAARLALLLGQEPQAGALQAQGDPRASSAPPLAQLEALLASHPLAHRVQAATQAAVAVVDRERRARFPQLGVSLQDWVSRKTHAHDVRLLGTVRVPLFDGPRVDRAQAASSAAEVEALTTRESLRSAALAARADYLAARSQCQALEASVAPAMRDAAQQSEAAYSEGALDLAATQTAQQARTDAEVALLTCLGERARAFARLDFAVGGFDGLENQ